MRGGVLKASKNFINFNNEESFKKESHPFEYLFGRHLFMMWFKVSLPSIIAFAVMASKNVLLTEVIA